MNLRFLPVPLAFATVACVAACGGGGGGGGAGAPPSGPSSAPTSTASPAISTGTQEAAAASALTALGSTLDFDQLGQANSAIVYVIKQAPAPESAAFRPVDAATTPAPGPCTSPGVEYAQNHPNTGFANDTILFFYDSGCTQERKLVSLSIAFNAGGGTANGYEKLFSETGGALVEYTTDAITFTWPASGDPITNLHVAQTVAVSPSATPFAQRQTSCTFGQSTACSSAMVATVTPVANPSASPSSAATPYEVGFSANLNGTQTIQAPPHGTVFSTTSMQLSMTGAAYTGALGSLTLSASPPPVVLGGTNPLNVSGNLSITTNAANQFAGAHIAITNSTGTITITVTSSGVNLLGGTITSAAGLKLATFVVDDSGNGTITFSNGTAAPVLAGIVM